MTRRPTVKSGGQVALMRQAGLVVAEVLAACQAAALPGVSTAELDAIAGDVIATAGALPSFLGLYGFPAHACISVDDEVIHGIPGHRRLSDGSVLKVDVGAIVGGFHADAAITVLVGTADPDPAASALSAATEAALWAGLAAVHVGARVGDIGTAVQGTLAGYGILQEFCGHGIGRALHEAPDVWNTAGQSGARRKLAVGHVLAIEPMAVLGGPQVHEQPDGWTVVTDSGAVGAHWEHTVALTPTGPWVLTERDGGAAELAKRGVGIGGPW